MNNPTLHNLSARILPLAVCLVLAFASFSPVQAYDDLPRILCTSTKLSWKGSDSLMLRFDATPSRKLHGNSAIHVQPVVVIYGDTVRFPELIYGTRIWKSYDRRHRSLRGKRDEDVVIVKQRMSAIQATYQRTAHAFKCNECTLIYTQYLETCCDIIPLGTTSMPLTWSKPKETPPVKKEVDNSLPSPVVVYDIPLWEANVTFIQPEAEKVKEREEDVTIRVTFKVGRAEIRPDFANNARELARVDSIFTPMQRHSDSYTIHKMSITGHTSPEGTYQMNMDLSRRRAHSMSEWLKIRYRFLRKTNLTTRGEGEDWDGLLDMVIGSGMAYEDEVVRIIENYDIFAGRKKKIMELANGAPYRFMLRYFYPDLRRMEMKLAYSVRSFNDKDLESIFEQRPGDLSNAEIYQVARRRNSDATITYHRKQYGREFDLALHYFPDDEAAIINASSAALIRGDMKLAFDCLQRVMDKPSAANNLGVYCWVCGKPELARKYFQKAAFSDPKAAKHNLEQLDRWEKTSKSERQ